MTEGWQNLGGVCARDADRRANPGAASPEPPLATTLSSAQKQRPRLSRLRHDYHQVLRELALALVQAALAPGETTDVPSATPRHRGGAWPR